MSNTTKIREALERTSKNGHDICDGPACTGCWKDDVREALAALAELDPSPKVEGEQPKVQEAIARLVQQANLCEFKDELGHDLRMNAAYLDLVVLTSTP